MTQATADLFDAFEGDVAVVEPLFRDFGGVRAFCGAIATVQCYHDNSLVRERLSEPGAGRVLVVDGGGSTRCALLGDVLAAKGVENGWAGVVVHGCIRDSRAIGEMAIGVKALGTNPRKTRKLGQGLSDVVVEFAGARFHPGHYLYADEDGILIAARDLGAS